MDSSAPDFEAAVFYYSSGDPSIMNVMTNKSCIAIVTSLTTFLIKINFQKH